MVVAGGLATEASSTPKASGDPSAVPEAKHTRDKWEDANQKRLSQASTEQKRAQVAADEVGQHSDRELRWVDVHDPLRVGPGLGEAPPASAHAAQRARAARLAYAVILNRQWPQNGTAVRRRQRIEEAVPPPGEKLPRVFALLAVEAGWDDRDVASAECAAVGGVHLRKIAKLKDGAELFGASQAKGPACVAHALVVAKPLQRQGLGGRLLAQVEETVAGQLGYSWLYLKSDTAVGFYQKGLRDHPRPAHTSGPPGIRPSDDMAAETATNVINLY